MYSGTVKLHCVGSSVQVILGMKALSDSAGAEVIMNHNQFHRRGLGPGFGGQEIFNFGGTGRKNMRLSLCVLD